MAQIPRFHWLIGRLRGNMRLKRNISHKIIGHCNNNCTLSDFKLVLAHLIGRHFIVDTKPPGISVGNIINTKKNWESKDKNIEQKFEKCFNILINILFNHIVLRYKNY